MRTLTGRAAGCGLVACLALLACGCAGRAAPAAPVDPVQQVPRAPNPPEQPSQPPPPPAPLPPVATAPVDDTATEECLVPGERGEPVSTVALTDPVDPAHAPHPVNDSERLLFRQIYEGLVRVDCRGRIRPALAMSWQADDSGRVWTLTLREARFADGAQLRSADILASWNGGGAGLGPRARGHLESATAADERTLIVTLRADVPSAAVLAHTDLTVVRRLPGTPWPVGTRGVRVEPGGQDSLTVTAAGEQGADAVPPLRFLLRPNRDRRDALDEGVDLLVTGDRAALEYARTIPRVASIPLDWQRTHVFISPWRGRAIPQLSAEARQTLATEAVRGDARGAEPPFSWQSQSGCQLDAPPPRSLPPLGGARFVYDRTDDTARDLAERFVGLARATARNASPLLNALLPASALSAVQRAAGLSATELAASASRGTDAGYVIALERQALDPCHQLRELTVRFPWLDPEAAVPLVDTRAFLILTRGRSGVIAEADGGLLIRRTGR